METSDAVTALAALAQDSRLDAFRLLVQASPQGLPAGEIAAALGVPPNTLSFHFDRLRFAGLVSVRRNGRSMIYSANFSAMTALVGFLTQNCCGGKESCGPFGGTQNGNDEPAKTRIRSEPLCATPGRRSDEPPL